MLRWSIKTIAKITATVKLLILTARCKQEFKKEKSTSSLNVLFSPMEEGQLHQGRWESHLTGKAALHKRILLFYGPSGKGKKKKRVIGKILTMESEQRSFFKTGPVTGPRQSHLKAFDVPKSRAAGQGFCFIRVMQQSSAWRETFPLGACHVKSLPLLMGS